MAKKTSLVGVDLERLSQSQAAWLIERPAPWLRDNSHKVLRNSDGTYDGRRLFAAARSIVGEVELDDDEIEKCLLASECFQRGFNDAIDSYLAFLDEIESRHGEAGLLAVFLATVADAKRQQRRDPTDLHENLFAQSVQCSECDRVRHGRQWIKSTPHGYTMKTTCPDCEKKQPK
jgi:hypothetical protein